jgi:ribosomal-protein-alanine N-acetyltransferase
MICLTAPAILEAADTPFDSARLWREPLRAAHAAELFDTLADERLYRFVPQDPPASVEWLAWRYGRLETRLSPDGDELWLNWALRLKAGGECIGTLQVTLRADASAYLAYELGSRWQRLGLATEACARLLQVLADRFGARSALAEVDTRNEASIRLLERLGFARTSMRCEADFFKGSRSDEFRYERRLGDADA